jgi:GAF domain-containing protein
MQKNLKDGFHPDAMSVHESEMLVATSEGSDALINISVSETLQLVRERLAIDVVFVSEFVDGHRVIRQVDAPRGTASLSTGTANPMEEAWGHRILEDRLSKVSEESAKLSGRAGVPTMPVSVVDYLSAPVLLGNGEVYGTLCCISFSADPHVRERDLRNLQSVAQLISTRIEKSQIPEAALYEPTEPSPLTLQPKR